MMKLTLPIALLLGQLASPSLAQQIPSALFSLDLLGLSDGCMDVVNKTITSCPGWLPQHVGFGDASFDLLDNDRLDQLCGSSCVSDLKSARTAIAKACTSPEDVMIPEGDIAYPATFLADRYLYASQLGCLKSSSGQYCDAVVAAWRNESLSEDWTSTQKCSDCELGVQKLQLSSPFGYDEESAASFAALTASCNAGGYAYATPTVYALNATAVPDPTPRACVDTYVVQEGDTCVTISLNHNVSTYGLISANGIDISCNLLPPVGSTICLPKTCTTYQLNMLDRCEDFTDGAHITREQFLSWNPMINDFCNNLSSWFGWNICLSSPDGALKVGQSNTIQEDAPVPANAQSQSNTHCGQWYETKKGDFCNTISLAFGISVDDFYFLNPQVDHQCSNLWLETSYCVSPVGNVATYANYPTSTPATVFPKPTPPPTTSYAPIPTPALSATADGTISGCQLYRNAYDESISDVFDLSKINSCKLWAAKTDVSVEDLLAWNPSLSATNCMLQPGKSYCILRSNEDSNPTGGSTPTPTNTNNGVPPPTQTQDGAISSCKKWYVVVRGDGCWAIANAAGIPLDSFYKWNPSVGECTALYPDYAVCVGI